MSPAASTRWCPTPEQVMILEEMYRGGVRTPNAGHIQQITAHLSHYGKIEGKNVFYWFQNHKARDRQKLRKRLLGKQLQMNDRMMMFQNPDDVNVNVNMNNMNDLHHQHLQRPPPPPPLIHHFDQLPCRDSSANPGFLQPPPQFVTSPCFAPHQVQPRSEDKFPRMPNTYTWKRETRRAQLGIHKENTGKIPNDDDWVMIKDDYVCHRDYYDYDDAEKEDSSKRPLKTLQLFPIKDQTSVKEDVNICGQPNTISH